MYRDKIPDHEVLVVRFSGAEFAASGLSCPFPLEEGFFNAPIPRVPERKEHNYEEI